MITLVHSNNSRRLVQALDETLAGLALPWYERAHVVVMAPATGTWLKMELARLRGRSGGTLPPLEFTLFGDWRPWIQNPQLQVLTQRHLVTLLTQTLPLLMARAPKLYAPLMNWVQQREEGPEEQRRQAEIAAETGRLFMDYIEDHYAHLKRWHDRSGALPPPGLSPYMEQTHRWQAALFRDLFGSGGVTASIEHREGTRWILPPQLCEQDDALVKDRTTLFFAPWGLSHTQQCILERLSRTNTLHIFFLNPSREYWEDATPNNLQVEESLLLSHLGETGRHDIHFFNTLCDYNHVPLFDPPRAATTQLTLLHETLLSRETPGTLPVDGSLNFLCAPSLSRECEIVCNDIWQQVKTQELHFNDIAVFIADRNQLDRYSTLLASQLRSARIPASLVEHRGDSPGGALTAISLLLELPDRPFTREVAMALLDHPLIGKVEHREAWLSALQSMATFGGNQPGAQGAVVHSFARAVERLYLEPLYPPEEQETSLAIPPSRAPELTIEERTELLSTTMALSEDRRLLRTLQLPLHKWTELLLHYLTSHLKTTDRADQDAVGAFVNTLHQLGKEAPTLAFLPHNCHYTAIKALLLSRLETLKWRRHGFRNFGVTIAPLGGARCIPFRHTYIIGGSQGAFPTRKNASMLDLRGVSLPRDPLSSTAKERYTLLETLMSTSDRLTLSYIGEDPKTQSERGFSTLYGLFAHEIVRLTGHVVTPERTQPKGLQQLGLLQIHPRAPYAPNYFPDLATWATAPLLPPSHSRSLYLAARAALFTEKRSLPPAPPARTARFSAERIHVFALRNFLLNPIQGVCSTGRVAPPPCDSLLETEENTLFLQLPSFRTRLLRNSLRELLLGHITLGELEHHLLQAISLAQTQGTYPLDFLSSFHRRVDLATLRSMASTLFPEFAHKRFLAPCLGRPQHRWQHPLSTPDPLSSLLGPLDLVEHETNTILVFAPPEEERYLQGWLTGILLSALGQLQGTRFTVFNCGLRKSRAVEFTLPCTRAARAYILRLLKEIRSPERALYLPLKLLLTGYRKALSPQEIGHTLRQVAPHTPWYCTTPLPWAPRCPLPEDPVTFARELLSGEGFSFFDELSERRR